MFKPYSFQYKYNYKKFTIEHPRNITSWDNVFYQIVYEALFDCLRDGDCSPHINADQFKPSASGNKFDFYSLAVSAQSVKGSGITKSDLKLSKKSVDIEEEKNAIALQLFFRRYPEFVTFIQNCRIKGNISIDNAEKITGVKTNLQNFIELKQITSELYKMRWQRRENDSEAQASVSNLGNTSEGLLKRAFDSAELTDLKKVQSPEISSYGDFVLPCLPNNLWISVKSDYSRERLLASGYSNDILGATFLVDATEISATLTRNMMKAGFLALYIPDVPVNAEQLENDENTYQQFLIQRKANKLSMPVNINGTPFVRKLSKLGDDLKNFIGDKGFDKRFTSTF